MNPPRKPSPTESPLLFEIDDEPLQETLTAWGGVPLVVQAFRTLGVSARVRQYVQIKQRERGYDEATMVESFVVLNAVGGECLDDFQHFHDDAGLKEMLGHEVPSPEAARQFLNRFHCEEKLEQARDGAEPEQRIATVDQDATIIESHKREALRTYEGERGYQPMLAVWAEMDVVLADEFRDGNVPAMMAPLAGAKRAFAALPETVTSFYYRGYSASHEKELPGWLRDEKRADGSQGPIGFAISARMSEAMIPFDNQDKSGQLPDVMNDERNRGSIRSLRCRDGFLPG